MKKLIFIAMIGLGSMLVGCSNYEKASDIDNNWSMHGRGVVTKEVEISGHKYIVINCGPSCNIIHSKSCSCGK
jgi:hypothetical protein